MRSVAVATQVMLWCTMLVQNAAFLVNVVGAAMVVDVHVHLYNNNDSLSWSSFGYE